MADQKKSPPTVNQNVSGDNNIVVGGDVSGIVVVGNENTVHQTIIQKFFNIFKSDSETLEQRNRRILLVEHFAKNAQRNLAAWTNLHPSRINFFWRAK
jgi:hypothetical protein